jgi:hypothetical protein
MDHELVHLAQHIDWEGVENEFKERILFRE